MSPLAILLFALPALSGAAAPACPQPSREPPSEAITDHALAIVEQAMAGNDARVMVMAAGWWRLSAARDASKEATAEATAMLVRAADVAGPDAIAWSMITRACGRDCGLANDPSERWLALDADNAAAWIAETNRALAANDDAAARAALARAAAAPRFDDYWVPAVNAALAAARAVPVPAELADYAESEGVPAGDAADLSAVGIALALAMPGAGRVPEECGKRADWHDDCLRLGRLMEARGDSVVGEQLGRSMQRHLLPEGSTAAAALAERQRRFDWLTIQAALLADEASEFPEALRRLVRTGTEMGAIELQLKEYGIPLTPPADWSADDGRREFAKRHPPPDPAALEACEPSKP